MPLSFMRDTVTVLRAPLAGNGRGSQKRDWANAESHEVPNCQVTGLQTSQDRDGRVLQVSDRYTLRAPYGADIRAGDRVVWGGDTYYVDGDVSHAKSPTGRASSTRCALAKWEG